MRIGVLGTGMVGQTLATRLVELGHDVTMGARSSTNEKAGQWAARGAAAGTPGLESGVPAGRAEAGTFADAARHGEVVINATAGTASLAALAAAGADALAGKVLVDVSNPLDFSAGMPPTLAVANTDSLGEQIQRTHPDVRVVKTLNTMNAEVMARPELVPGDHTVFMAGEDAAAKALVVDLLVAFGWPRHNVMDLGGIRAARGMEMYLPLWLSVMAAQGTAAFNVHVVRA